MEDDILDFESTDSLGSIKDMVSKFKELNRKNKLNDFSEGLLFGMNFTVSLINKEKDIAPLQLCPKCGGHGTITKSPCQWRHA